MKAVADSTVLIFLAKLNRLSLLRLLYEEVVIPEAVYEESVTQGLFYGYPDARIIEAFLRSHEGEFLSVCKPSVWPEGLEETPLGQGEKETIALAYEIKAEALLDDNRARKIARNYGLRTRGLLGILVQGYQSEVISAEALAELLDLIEIREDIWIRPDLCKELREKLLLQAYEQDDAT